MEIYPLPPQTLPSPISAELLSLPGQPPILSLSLDIQRYPQAGANLSNLRHQLCFPLWKEAAEIPQMYLSYHDGSQQLVTSAVGESVACNPFSSGLLLSAGQAHSASKKDATAKPQIKKKKCPKTVVQISEHAPWVAGMALSQIERSLTLDAAVNGWARALSLRDDETSQHTQRVTDLATRMGLKMGFREEQMLAIERGAKLHDIGKMGIPDKVLLKPGPLSEDDWSIMQTHPVLAFEMLQPIPYIDEMLDIPYCHHERWDGSGYPRGIKGQAIPISARIFSVIDVWDALCSDRPYRKAWPRNNVMQYIKDHAGSQFDPFVVDCFLDLISQIPA